MAAVPEGFEDLFARPLIGQLATVRPDGAPTVTPMWFAWDGEHLRFTHTTRREKLRNFEHENRVAFSIIDPDQPYRYLQALGEVDHIEADPTGSFYVELARRYGDESPSAPPDAADRVIISVRPTAYTKRATAASRRRPPAESASNG